MKKEALAAYIRDEERLREAESLLRRIEEENSYESMVSLAQILEETDNENLEEEICGLYKAAAEGGKIPQAMVSLASIYRYRDEKSAAEMSFRYAYEAMLLGNKEAEYILADLFRCCSHELALHWMKHAANQGHVEAALETAVMYDRGYGVSMTDYPDRHAFADVYYRLAADLGNAGAAKKLTMPGKIFRWIRHSEYPDAQVRRGK